MLPSLATELPDTLFCFFTFLYCRLPAPFIPCRVRTFTSPYIPFLLLCPDVPCALTAHLRADHHDVPCDAHRPYTFIVCCMPCQHLCVLIPLFLPLVRGLYVRFGTFSCRRCGLTHCDTALCVTDGCGHEPLLAFGRTLPVSAWHGV